MESELIIAMSNKESPSDMIESELDFLAFICIGAKQMNFIRFV